MMRVAALAALLAALPASAGVFADVVLNWYYPAVEALAQAGFVEGYPEGGFVVYRGYHPITRHEMAAVVQRVAEARNRLAPGSRPAAELVRDPVLMEALWGPRFRDVPADHWASMSVRKLARAGIMEGGPGEGASRRDEPLNRGDAALVLHRLLRLWTDPSVRPDDEPPLVQAAVDGAAQAGVLEGHPDGTYRAGEPLTRYEMAVAICRLLDYVDSLTQPSAP